MFLKFTKIFIYLFFFSSLFISSVNSEIIKKLVIKGNDRISDETIKMLSSVSINTDIKNSDINRVLKSLYNSNFFADVSVTFLKNIFTINVKENPIIQDIKYEGIKSKRILEIITSNLNLKPRYSFNDILLKDDIKKMKLSLQNLGYYFPEIDTYKEDLNDNTVNVSHKITLGKKAKIKKISFIGDKIYKDKKLKSLIVSEEYKFWKFISGKKYLNKNLISFDEKLLKNFYLNKGYHDVQINSSFAKLVNDYDFELIFNIKPYKKFYFNNLSIELPVDYDENNFKEIFSLFKKLKDEPYSINSVEDILEKIDIITTMDQFESVSASVTEDINKNKINLKFIIEESDKIFVEKINIFGNNVTRENVIRNQFEIDEGDPFNEILANKSINNIKSLNFFKNVRSEIIDGKYPGSKIINIKVEEKPTGEISAGAGVGTSGSTISVGIKENNYLGKGLGLTSNLTINQESLKGQFSVTNPNYNNTDKLVYFSLEAVEIDRLTDFGYKTNKTGFSLGTNFEFLDNFSLGVGSSNYFEKIETDSTASTKQREQKGNYFDSFLNLNFNYDTRNQKFQTTDGIRSKYFIDIPFVSETSTLTNRYDFKKYSQLYENNISVVSFFLTSANSLQNKDVKLTERIFLPSNKLRGFEKGKVGPKDGNDFIGGNYAAAFNLSTSVPQILENSDNIDFLIFFDAANIWGVDYDSTINDSNEVRSSVGIGIDWLTPIGPLNFTLAEPLTKSENDITESFRFNLGTTF